MEETLSYYYIFYEVAKNQSLSRAAKSLYISQPAISKAVKKLETLLGITLFQRSSRGVKLTKEGEVLYEHVCAAFDALRAGERSVVSMKSLESGQIRIGVSTTLCKFLLLPYLKNFIADYPHIKLSLYCQSTNQTLSLLEEGKIDLGLIGKPKNTRSIVFHPLTKIQDIFVASPSYLKNLSLFPLISHADLSEKEKKQLEQQLFDKATTLLLDKDNMSRQYIDDYLFLYHIRPSHLLEISTMDLLIEFAKIGLGVACVIRNFVENELSENILFEIPLSVPLKQREVGFAYAQKSILSNASRQFLKGTIEHS